MSWWGKHGSGGHLPRKHKGLAELLALEKIDCPHYKKEEGSQEEASQVEKRENQDDGCCGYRPTIKVCSGKLRENLFCRYVSQKFTANEIKEAFSVKRS